MKTAIFGGTFDPIHSAHLIVAREAADAFSLDRVLFIPSSHPPHKGAHAPYEDRYRMVELPGRDAPAVPASRLAEETGSSYANDAIAQARARRDERERNPGDARRRARDAARASRKHVDVARRSRDRPHTSDAAARLRAARCGPSYYLSSAWWCSPFVSGLAKLQSPRFVAPPCS